MMFLAALLLLFQDLPVRVAEEIQKLRSDDYAVRAAADQKLAGFGKEAVPALEALLKEPDADLVSHARSILGTIDRAARLQAVLEPEKRTSVDLLNVPMSEAVKRIFEPFGLNTRVGPGNNRAGQPLTLKLERATFWQAWDAIYQMTDSMGGSVEARPGDDTSRELDFIGPFRKKEANTMTSVGDYRILAGPMASRAADGPAGCGVHLILVCPVWAVPRKAAFSDLALGGVKLGSQQIPEPRVRMAERALTGSIRRVVRWESVDYLHRSKLGPGNTVKVSGTLILSFAGAQGDYDAAVPFAIDSFPMGE